MKKLIVALALLFLSPTSVSAESISNFDVNIVINQDGQMTITENILYDFESTDRHGIFRDIPRTTKLTEGKYRIQDYTVNKILRDQQNEQYKTSFNGDFFNIKIGDPDKTINGEHRYTIQYNVKNGIATLDNQDELYWNITGNDWEIPIMNVSATIQPPTGTTIKQSTCFTGIKGSTEKNCNISQDQTRFTAKELAPHEGLTIVAAFPPQTFPTNVLSDHPATGLSKLQWILIAIAAAVAFIFLNVVLPLILWNWYKKGQKGKEPPPVHVNFDIPQSPSKSRLAPALAGALDTAQLEQNDVVATIYDLAIRKHLIIRQVDEQQNLILFSKKNTKYYLEKAENPPNDPLTPHETILMNRLFGATNKEELDQIKDLYNSLPADQKIVMSWLTNPTDKIDIETLKPDFYLTFQKMEESVYKQLQDLGYYKGNPKTRKTLFITLGILTIFTGSFILAPLLFFLASKQTNRTKRGVDTDWQIDGLKEFLKKMDRNYTWQANQLAIVEQMIPYAMALGYIDKFMEQLKIIRPDYHPTWYSGNTPFYNINTSLMSTMTSSFTTHAPSSSSGFSGGSGGGGGGGGGGSW